MGTITRIISPVVAELLDEVRSARDICISERNKLIAENIDNECWEWSHKYYISREFIWDILRRNHNRRLTAFCWQSLYEIEHSILDIQKELVESMPDQLMTSGFVQQ